MRLPRTAWELVTVCAVAAVAWVLVQYGVMLRWPPGRSTVPIATEQPLASPSTAAGGGSTSSTLGLPVYDPSIDPRLLERAYAPVPESLPPQARPKTPDIHPPERTWRRLQRQDDAVAY